MRKLGLLLFLFIPVIIKAQSKPNNVTGDPNHFDARVPLSELTDPTLSEVSGIAASHKNPGLIWTQNDSGNKPAVYLVDKNLKIRLTVKLKGILNRDWEDIAVGPGPEKGKTYVYVADIGDNFGIFPTKMIYRFEEPQYDSAKGVKEVDAQEVHPIIFRLPGGDVRDAESMLIDPNTKHLYVLTKEDTARLYQIPFPYLNTKTKSDTLTATLLGLCPLPKIASAAFSAKGDEILVKNSRRVWYWKNVANKPLEEVLKVKGIMIPYDMEPQGEAITFAFDGSGFYTLSEMKKNKKTFLYFYKRK